MKQGNAIEFKPVRRSAKPFSVFEFPPQSEIIKIEKMRGRVYECFGTAAIFQSEEVYSHRSYFADFFFFFLPFIFFSFHQRSFYQRETSRTNSPHPNLGIESPVYSRCNDERGKVVRAGNK